MRKEKLGLWLLAIPMMVLAIATIYPMVYAVNISLKSRREYVLDRLGADDRVHTCRTSSTPGCRPTWAGTTSTRSS